jgi:hypothetical protein
MTANYPFSKQYRIMLQRDNRMATIAVVHGRYS